MNADTIKDVYLKTPNLSDEYIIGYNVGIRPFRRSGVRLEVAYTRDKMLVHNYGYGGAGLSLCWGGAHEVMQLLQQEKVAGRRIAILGAGVIGMACAYELLSQGLQVKLYADKFTPDLTSNVAAGIFSYPVLCGGENEAQRNLLAQMFDVSASRYLANLKNPEFAGLNVMNDYIFDANVDSHHVLINEYKSVALEEAKVMVHFDNGLTKPATSKRVFGLDGKIFINDLFAKVQAKGAVIQKKHFRTQKEIEVLDEDIIINCTSLGSRELFEDRDFIPTRGQLIYFKPQPGIDYSTYECTPDENFWVKIYPWHDRIILNGVYEHHVEECVQDRKVVNVLLDYARASFANK